jgi:hypothetical protein
MDSEATRRLPDGDHELLANGTGSESYEAAVFPRTAVINVTVKFYGFAPGTEDDYVQLVTGSSAFRD